MFFFLQSGHSQTFSLFENYLRHTEIIELKNVLEENIELVAPEQFMTSAFILGSFFLFLIAFSSDSYYYH